MSEPRTLVESARVYNLTRSFLENVRTIPIMASKTILDRDESFWEKYSKGRPRMPDSFIDRIYNYHAEHGGEWETLHEPGVGPAIHSSRLAKKFRRVIVSDPSEKNFETARHRLSAIDKCEIRVAKLEDIDGFPVSSVDVVVALNMIHFTKLDKAMEAVAYQLKPGGTFATATFAMSVLDNPQAQDVWMKMWQRGAELTIIERDRLVGEAFTSSRSLCASLNDAIPLSETHFRPGAVRLKINFPQDQSWWYRSLVPPSYDNEFPLLPSEIGPNDQVENVFDGDWTFSTNLNGLREAMAASPWSEKLEKFEDLWHEMQNIVGDEVVTGNWPVMLVLATKS